MTGQVAEAASNLELLATTTETVASDGTIIVQISTIEIVAPGVIPNATRSVVAPTRESLLNQPAQQGVKHTPESIVAIGKNASGKVVFLEKGTAQAGLRHIVERHAVDFAARGIPEWRIPEAVVKAATEGRALGTAGSGRNSRVVYEMEFDGGTQRIAVGEAGNGFIVTAHPAN